MILVWGDERTGVSGVRGKTEDPIRVEAPTVADARKLIDALQGLRTKLVEWEDHAEVEVGPDTPWTRPLVLTTTASWLADRKLAHTAIHLGANCYRMLPEQAR
jgi:hypothetical protein